MSDEGSPRVQQSILGLSTTELAGLSVEEITGNQTAIKMLMHYYKQLVDENATLKNDNNTLNTYMTAYDRQKSNSATGAVLLALSNIVVGLGVNFLTGNVTGPGLAALAIGVVIVVVGIYFSFFKDKN